MSDTSILNQPKSISILQRTKFSLSFKRLPHMTYFCQKVNIPGAINSVSEQPTPFINRIMPGNKIHYSPLRISFLLQENIEGWIEIHNWLKGVTLREGHHDYANLSKLNKVTKNSEYPQYSDAICNILSTQNNPIIRVTYVDCFPISITDIDFDSEENVNSPVQIEATFGFFYHRLEKIE